VQRADEFRRHASSRPSRSMTRSSDWWRYR
jgi:hypothetical protein